MQKIVKKALKDALKKMNIENIEPEFTPSKSHADFSTNISLKLAKINNMNPKEFAEKLISFIPLQKLSIAKIEIAGPGFINFFISNNLLDDIVENIIEKKDTFGMSQEGIRINLEYVSANPTGFLHVGHARGAVYGSVLASVMRFAGNKVDTEYYINDAGSQIDNLGYAVYVRYKQELGIDIELPENSYHGEDIIWVAKKIKELYGEKYKDSPYDEIESFLKIESKKILLEKIKEHLKNGNIEIDNYFSESTLYNAKIVEILNILQDVIYKKDGATWLKTTLEEDDKDRVLVKADGKYTYLTPDIAYHFDKAKRGYDKLVNIWGADHFGYIKRMEFALSSLGYKDIMDVITIQLVKLVKDGKDFIMSKRSGTSFTFNELIDMVGPDATRYFLICRSNNSNLDFDIDEAKKQESDNPVFYIQYAFARSNQLLNKLEAYESSGIDENAKDLIMHLNEFPKLIVNISSNYKVHHLSTYMLKLAKEFHAFYNNNKILGTTNEKKYGAVIKAANIVLKNGLKLLGINAPERM